MVWHTLSIFKKYNIYIINVGEVLNLSQKGLLGEGSTYSNPCFIPTIYEIVNETPEKSSYTIDTKITKIGNNLYKIGSIDNKDVQCKIKLLVYEK